MAAAAATGIGVSWSSSKLTSSIDRPRWITSSSARSSSSNVIKVTAVPLSFDEKTKSFSLPKSADASYKTKENFNFLTRRKARGGLRTTPRKAYRMGFSVHPVIEMSAPELTKLTEPYYGHGIAEIATSSTTQMSNAETALVQYMQLIDLDPATAKMLIPFLGPFLSTFAFLFILRIVMSWYPKLPVEKFPYIVAYAPTEPLLIPTRKVIPPLGGVDVTPVVWFGLISFLNEILVGPQGLLVLLSQKV